MSVLPSKADIRQREGHVRYVPKPDMIAGYRYSLVNERSIFIKGMLNRLKTAISTPTLNQTRR
jgi:hypothetical protein